MTITTAFISVLVWGVISAAIGLWVTYYLLKCAIRDGINESRLGDRRALTRASTGANDTLPDMRAD
jgi:hypothetical protein